MTLFVTGSIDTVTAPDLEQELKSQWNGVAELVLDLSGVDFITSAGIRVILLVHKQMQSQGKLILRNVNEDVREVFVLTGLDDVLHFE